MSLRDEFLAAAAVPFEDVDVNGTTVRVRALTAAMQLQVEAVSQRDAGDITFWILENCLLDPETGERLFAGSRSPTSRIMPWACPVSWIKQKTPKAPRRQRVDETR
jgi:hypothetical protein